MGFPYILPSSLLGGDGAVAPSNRITLGLIGAGNINTHHREAFLAEKDARIIAVCDPVTARRKDHRDCINEACGDTACADYRHFHELLAKEDIATILVCLRDRLINPHHLNRINAQRFCAELRETLVPAFKAITPFLELFDAHCRVQILSRHKYL